MTRFFIGVCLCWVASAQQSARETGTIEGTAFNQLSGEILKKVQVTARRSSGIETSSVALTAAGGHFALPGLAPGSYLLFAARNGFIGQSYGAKSPNRSGTPLTVEAGGKLTGIDFHLWPQGVITGRVLDEDGDPVAAATVQVLRPSYVRGRQEFSAVQAATTNDRGEYRIFGLAPGKYLVSAAYPNFRLSQPSSSGAEGQEVYAKAFYPNAMSPDSAAPLDVTPGAELRGIELSLVKVRAYRIRGKVLDPNNGPPGRVAVWLVPRGGGTLGNMRSEQSAEQGRFEIQNVVPGAYTINAVVLTEHALTGHTIVDVTSADLDGVSVALLPPASIRGKAVVEGKAVAALTSLGVYLEGKEPGLGISGSARPEADGSFQLQVTPDSYRITVTGLSGNLYLKSIKFGGAAVTDAGLDLTQGVPPGELTVLVSPSGAQVEGTVLDGKDQPVAEAQVVAIPDSARRGVGRLFRTATTAASGHYVIRGIAPGDYTVLAWDDVEFGAWQDPAFLKPFESGAETITLKEDSHETKQLRVQHALRP